MNNRINSYVDSYSDAVLQFEGMEKKNYLLSLSKEDLFKESIGYIQKKTAYTYGTDSSVETKITFHKTVRIPDDGKDYPLPASLGNFTVKHVDDYDEKVPVSWLSRGGVMLPIYQSEAMWISFIDNYPMAIKVGTGKINAINGQFWAEGLNFENQDYIVSSEQPWIDGYNVGNSSVRQFVANPLGRNKTVEEKITGKAVFGGIQIQAFPYKSQSYFEDFIESSIPQSLETLLKYIVESKFPCIHEDLLSCEAYCDCESLEPMGLGMGGRIRQEIFQDPYEQRVWDLDETSRCFVHLCNSYDWKKYTNDSIPVKPIDMDTYQRYKMPWFDYYSENVGLEAPDIFNTIEMKKATEI
jgi:hypothetical protein